MVNFKQIVAQRLPVAIKCIVLVSLGYGFMFWAQLLYNLFVPFSLVIFAICALLIVVKPQWGFYAVVFFSIISEPHFLYGFELFQSIYTFKIGGFSLIDYLLFGLVFRMMLTILMKGLFRWQTTSWDRGFIIITGLIFMASIIGIGFGAATRNWLVDLKAMLFLIVPFFTTRFFLKQKEDIFRLFEVILYTLLGKVIVYFAGYLIKFTISDDVVIRVTLTSDVVMYPLILLFCIVLYLLVDQKLVRWLATFFGLVTVLCIFWGFGRENWLWTLVSIVLFTIISDKRIRIGTIKIIATAAFATALLITIIRPTTWEYAVTSIKSFTLKVEGKGEEKTGAVRAIEWINVHQLLVDSHTVLIGRGLGATWFDRYHPLPSKRDIYSFPITETEHVFTHMVFSKFYLKFGILGSLILWMSLVIPWIKTISWSRQLPFELQQVILAILMSNIGIFAKIEINRIALIGGFIFGALSVMYLIYENNKLFKDLYDVS